MLRAMYYWEGGFDYGVQVHNSRHQKAPSEKGRTFCFRLKLAKLSQK